MDGRKSECSIVPMSPGNRTHGDPGEGRGRRGMEPVERKLARAFNLGSVVTRLHRIAELGRPAGAWRSTAPQRTHAPEESDAGIPHVRICGGPGRVTARVYPTPIVMVPGTHLRRQECSIWYSVSAPSQKVPDTHFRTPDGRRSSAERTSVKPVGKKSPPRWRAPFTLSFCEIPELILRDEPVPA